MPQRLPYLFIGSTLEALDVATAIRDNLSQVAEVVLWTEAFPVGASFLEALTAQTAKADFAILVMTPDDKTESRGEQRPSPRDNLVFELGLFTGVLGAQRTFCIHPDEHGLKFPTDLLGITTARYGLGHPDGLTFAVNAACDNIRRTIRSLGLRSPGTAAAAFCSRIAGFWWEYITPVNISSLGFLELVPDGSGGIRIVAESHREDGSRAADWWTEGCAVNALDRKLLYVWKGRYIHAPDSAFEGFGDFSFNDSTGPFVRGHGFFAEMNVKDLARTRKRAGRISRCSQSDVEIMQSGDRELINTLVKRRLAER